MDDVPVSTVYSRCNKISSLHNIEGTKPVLHYVKTILLQPSRIGETASNYYTRSAIITLWMQLQFLRFFRDDFYEFAWRNETFRMARLPISLQYPETLFHLLVLSPQINLQQYPRQVYPSTCLLLSFRCFKQRRKQKRQKRKRIAPSSRW